MTDLLLLINIFLSAIIIPVCRRIMNIEKRIIKLETYAEIMYLNRNKRLHDERECKTKNSI